MDMSLNGDSLNGELKIIHHFPEKYVTVMEKIECLIMLERGWLYEYSRAAT